MTTQAVASGPSKKMYGVTHSLTGEPIVIEPKTVKVGIGLAAGPAIHVYIDLARKWVVQTGTGEHARARFDTRLEAQKAYRKGKETAPECKYPQRLPYFTFSHVSADGTFEPDWEAIELHGPVPTEIDIVFVRDDPFSASYQLWTQTEKKCDGDGMAALRINSMAAGPEQLALAEASRKRGEKYFPVSECWIKRCQYSQPAGGRPSPCRPRGLLLFQLVNNPRLGGTAYWDTTGFRSISQVFSSIETFKRVTGSGNPDRGFVAGIPLKMVLRPYKTSHDGRSTTQYGVSLEFRAESALALKRSLIQAGVDFRLAAAPVLKLLEGAPAPQRPADERPEDIPAAIAAEFDPSPIAEADRSPDPAPADDDSLDGPIGDLGEAWGPPASPDPDAISRAISPAVTNGTAQPSEPPPAASLRAPAPEVRKFWELCRARGMSDSFVIQKLGSEGFETFEEITVAALPGLMQWADQYRPANKQGTLL